MSFLSSVRSIAIHDVNFVAEPSQGFMKIDKHLSIKNYDEIRNVAVMIVDDLSVMLMDS